MTTSEERAVEQRTRIREVRFMLLGLIQVANKSYETIAEIELELRVMARRLMEIETQLEEKKA